MSLSRTIDESLCSEVGCVMGHSMSNQHKNDLTPSDLDICVDPIEILTHDEC